MIVTTIKFGGSKLGLIAAGFNNRPYLLSVDWIGDSDSLQASKSIKLLKKHHNIQDKDIKVLNQNSLSKDNPIETVLMKTLSQLKEYESGKLQNFDIPLDLTLGTEFQQKVWRALQQIPYGQTISYAQLAKNIGKSTAYRAVANANGRNPFSIIIPCHRVIASDGGLGGYTGGLDKKRLLLQIEKQL